MDALADVARALTTVTLAPCPDDDQLGLLRTAEVVRRELAFLDERLLAEVEHPGIPARVGYGSTVQLLRDLLRISPHEASTRLAGARTSGPRQALDGTPLAPLHPLAAERQAAGVISAAHLRVVAETIRSIPAACRAEYAEQVEASLLTHAAQYDPATLARFGRRWRELIDPDGALTDDADHARFRALTLRINPDGSSGLRGHLDPHATESLAVCLDALGQPRPGPEGERDRRSPGILRHDALAELTRSAITAGVLPATGGTAATILLTAAVDQWEKGTGLVRTGHGALIPVPTAKAMAGGDAKLVPVVLGRATEVVAYGTGQRLFTRTQRLAMIARDGGCTWPSCDQPAARCEVPTT